MPKKATETPKTPGSIKKIDVVGETRTVKNSSTLWTWKNIKQALLRHYTQTPADILFQRFKLGAMIFFLGLVIIYGAYQLLEHSLTQEIVVLIGLILIGGGFLLAILAQIRLLIGRLIHILFHKRQL